MKKLLLIFLFVFLINYSALANSEENTNTGVSTYSLDNMYFGLADKEGNEITKDIYGKLIPLGKTVWIAQKGSKFGLMNNKGEFIVQPKYAHAERYLGRYAKLGNIKDFGLYDEFGNVIIKPEYSVMELLFGKYILTCKKFKYGLMDLNGEVILDNDFEYIYMTSPTTIRLKFAGEWFEIDRKEAESSYDDDDYTLDLNENDFSVTHVITNTGYISGYSALTATDYVLKILSSLSPAYEETIDELMLSHGTDTISIFMKMKWLPKFPVVYAQKYGNYWINPNSGPLSDLRSDMIKRVK